MSNLSMSFGQKLQMLRKSKNLNQAELGDVLKSTTLNGKPVHVAQISLWETGKKIPGTMVLMAIADFFNVSMDYLCGRSTENGYSLEPVSNGDFTTTQISYLELPKFDKKPIYVTFKNKEHENEWGIVDIMGQKIQFSGLYALPINPSLSEHCIFTVYTPDYANALKAGSRYKLNRAAAIELDQVYVSMKSSDPLVRKDFDGWYRNTEDRKYLINHKGYVLPYDGLDVSFYLYSSAE